MRLAGNPVRVAAAPLRRAGTLCTHIEWRRHTPRSGVAPDALPLLMIHGFSCGKDDWGSLPRALASKSRREVLTFDNRGVGQSSSPEGEYTIAEMADDCLRVLDLAEVPRAHVLGISLGGMLAQELAVAYPSRVAGLILGGTTHGGLAAAPVPSGFLQTIERWAAEPAPNASPLVDAFIEWMLPVVEREMPSGQRLKSLIKTYFKHTPRTSAGLRGQLAAMRRFNSTQHLKSLGESRSTLVVCGDQDAVMRLPNSMSLAERIPNATLLVRQGAGHFFWAHEAAECSSQLAQHITRMD